MAEEDIRVGSSRYFGMRAMLPADDLETAHLSVTSIRVLKADSHPDMVPPLVPLTESGIMGRSMPCHHVAQVWHLRYFRLGSLPPRGIELVGSVHSDSVSTSPVCNAVGLTLSRPSPTALMTLSARSPPPPSSVKTDRWDLYSSNKDIPLMIPAGSNREKKFS
jgi:hypothetical protein